MGEIIDNDYYISKIENKSAIKFSDEQRKILEGTGGMVILAAAGSGKTTSLLNLIVKRILSGEIRDSEKLLCTTFSKAGADELNVKMKCMLENLGINKKVNISTIHAFYLRTLRVFGIDMKVCSDSNLRRYVSQACKEQGLRIDAETITTLIGILSFQINNIMTDNDVYYSYVYTIRDKIDLNKFKRIRRAIAVKKEADGVLDYDDMQLYMYSLCVRNKNEAVIDYLNRKYEYFYIDEGQDVSLIQNKILSSIIRDKNKFVMIGDDDQCIYQWRGAEPKIIMNIASEYDISQYELTTNYRCKSTIVEHALCGIENNAIRYNKKMTAKEVGGNIEIFDTFGNLYTMSVVACDYIRDLIEKGVEQDDIIVLSRNNNHLSIIKAIMYSQGIYAYASEDMKITKMYIYKNIRGIFKLVDNNYNASVMADTLWRLCRFMSAKKSAVIAEFMDGCALSSKMTIEYILYEILNLDIEVSYKRDLNIPKKLKKSISVVCSEFAGETVKDLRKLKDIMDNEDEKSKHSELLKLFIDGQEFMNKTDDAKRTLYGVVDYINDMINIKGYDETIDFLDMLEHVENNEDNIDREKIYLYTIHKAKGLEWKNVIIFADDNVSFPSFDGINIMLDNGVSVEDISNSIDEGRRLHYVAMTRAKDNLAVFSNIDNPSVYLLEAFGCLKKDGMLNKKIIDAAGDTSVLNENIREFKRRIIKDGKLRYIELKYADSEKVVNKYDKYKYGRKNEEEEYNKVGWE